MNFKPAKKQRLILRGQSIPELKTTRYHFACRIRQYKSPYLRVASNFNNFWSKLHIKRAGWNFKEGNFAGNFLF